jgi:hypothetical protein
VKKRPCLTNECQQDKGMGLMLLENKNAQLDTSCKLTHLLQTMQANKSLLRKGLE